MTEPKSFLHLGAHRTGSSSFQMFLGHNQTVLESAGFNLFYPNRDGAEGGYGRKIELPSPVAPPSKHRPYFRHFVKPIRNRFGPLMHPDRPYSILSEENILGRMGLLFRGKFFPQAGLRVELVRRGLINPLENTTLVIRNYGDFYRSAAAMLAQTKRQPDFAQPLFQQIAMAEGWPELVAQLMQNGKLGHLTVIPYEHRGDDINLLRLLVGPKIPEGLQPVPRRPNVSASAQALDVIQQRFAKGETLRPRERMAIIDAFPVGAGNDRYDPFSDKQKAALTQLYNRDLERLADRKDITLITNN